MWPHRTPHSTVRLTTSQSTWWAVVGVWYSSAARRSTRGGALKSFHTSPSASRPEMNGVLFGDIPRGGPTSLEPVPFQRPAAVSAGATHGALQTWNGAVWRGDAARGADCIQMCHIRRRTSVNFMGVLAPTMDISTSKPSRYCLLPARVV